MSEELISAVEAKSIREACKAYAAENVAKLSAELLEWYESSILPDGAVRHLARMCSQFIGKSDSLPVAKSMIEHAALTVASRPAPAVQVAEGERSAWLIEHGSGGRAWYLAAHHRRGGYGFHWEHEIEKAIHFSREEDAGAVLEIAGRSIGQGEIAKAREHIFYAAPTPATVDLSVGARSDNGVAVRPAPVARCDTCDGTGDVHDATGEWRGRCPHCAPATVATEAVAQGYWQATDGGPNPNYQPDAGEAVAQGGGVDVEKVMALVDEYGESMYQHALNSHGGECPDYDNACDTLAEIRALLASAPAVPVGDAFISAGVVINNNQPGSQYIVEAHHGQTVCVGTEVFIK